MPVPGGTTRKFLQRVLSPAQKDVALLVALELELGVDHERRGEPYSSTCTEWSMTRSTGWSGLMRCGSPPSAFDRVAHRGEIDDRGNAGEVLQQHAARAERDLFLFLAGDVPLRHRLDVGLLHESIVFVAQEILEQNLEAERELGGVAAGDLVEGGEAKDRVRLPVDGERRAAAEGVLACHGIRLSSSADSVWPMRG